VSIYGIGVDIVEIKRINSSIERLGDAFAKKILHPNEFDKYSSTKQNVQYLAKRFAAKEAFAKAFGTGIVEGVTLPRIEIVNNEDGKPKIVLHGETYQRYKLQQIKSIHLSISDEKNYAVAQVVLEK